MFADEAMSQGAEKDISTPENQPIALPLFAVQLQNIVPLEVKPDKKGGSYWRAPTV